MNKQKDKELERVTGWPYTHYDCPKCGEVIEMAGDTRDELITCDVCNYKFIGD